MRSIRILCAAKSANAHDFIMNFPDGYDTMVEPGGRKLPGGQKQRVVIARVILRNPAILILNEATSTLDNKSEKIVQEANNTYLRITNAIFYIYWLGFTFIGWDWLSLFNFVTQSYFSC